MATVNPIETEADYDVALERVTVLMDDLSGPDGQIDNPDHPSRIELDTLVDSIEAYEAVHHPIESNSVAATER